MFRQNTGFSENPYLGNGEGNPQILLRKSTPRAISYGNRGFSRNFSWVHDKITKLGSFSPPCCACVCVHISMLPIASRFLAMQLYDNRHVIYGWKRNLSGETIVKKKIPSKPLSGHRTPETGHWWVKQRK